jgi:O-antigen/teichoic acid export membrane protein
LTRKLIGAGFFLTVANVMAGGLGYVFQVFIGRMLAPSDFALFSAIMSVSVMLTSPISAIFTVASRNITQLFAAGHTSFALKSYIKFTKICLLGSLILIIGSLVFEQEITSYINNSTQIQIIFLSLIILCSALGMMNNAYLQGAQKFEWLAAMSVTTVVFKIAVVGSLIFLGYGVDGALIGIVISSIGAYFIVSFYIRGQYKKPEIRIHNDRAGDVFNFNKLPPVLIATLSITIMTQLDVVVVNNYFDPDIAGKYAAAATLGKAVLYLPGGIILALLPIVAEAQAKNNKVASYIIIASIATFLSCSCVAFIYWEFGGYISVLLFGEKYSGVGEILKYYGFAMLPMAMLVVAEYFLIALGKVIYAWLSLLFAPLQVILIIFYHESLYQVLLIISVCGFLLLISGYFFLYRFLRSQN